MQNPSFPRTIVYSALIVLIGGILACNLSASRAGGQASPSASLPMPTLHPTENAVPHRQAQADAWQPAGFGGAGNFDGVFFDQNQPGVVYAASDVTGIFRSADDGDHWEMRSVGLGNYEVSSFAVDPFDSNTLYAGAGAISTSDKAGIYVSHDAGLTWQHLTSTFTNTITFRRWRTINAIAPDPAQQGYLLSGSRQNGVWQSTDGGISWTQVYTAPLTSASLFETYDDDPADPHPAPASIVLFDPVDPTVVYAGFDGGGAIKSWDSGLTWEPINNGLPAAATVKYVAVGSGDDVLYAAVGEAGVYRSDDGGDLWQAVNGFPPTVTLGADAWVSSVAVNPNDSDIAYLTLTTHNYPVVWKTTDGGATWVAKDAVTVDPVNNPTEAWIPWAPGGGYYPHTLTWQIALDPHDPNRLFYVDFWDIARSTDAGEHWTNQIVGAQNTCVTDLLEDQGVLYATHWDAGLLASTNNGVTWTAVLPSTVNDPALAGHYWKFAVAQNGGTKYYFTTSDLWSTDRNYGQVLRSTDGISWTVVFTNTRPAGAWMGGAMLGLAVDPATPSTLYIAQDAGQVYRSTSNGDPGTWAPTSGQPAGRSFTFALAVDGQHRIFAGTLNDGLWRSTNGGNSWEQVLTGQGTIYQVLAVPGAVYASAGDGNLYRSEDGGDTWLKLTNFSPADDGDGVGDQGMAIAVDPQNPDHILFSQRDTWHNSDAAPGMVESTDGGVTWTPVNTGLGNLSVGVLTFGSGGDIFAGTSCGGIWRRPSSLATSRPVYLPLVVRNSASLPGLQPLPLSSIAYWAYQIAEIAASGSVDALAASHYDMLVLEPTRTDWSSNDKDFDTKGMVTQLKNSLAHDGAHRKLVLAYIDIGQAEDWRWYWTWSTGWDCTGPRPADWPDYILTCDPDGWTGNYPVAYWDARWKDIVIYGQNTGSDPGRDYTSVIDEAIRDGFDGIYLDWVEAFENQEVIAAAQAAGKDPAVEMIAFVQEIRTYAAARHPRFLIIQQNAAALVDGHPELFNVIDAIAQEEIWYGGVAADDWNAPNGYDSPVDPTLTAEYIGFLDQYLAAGLPVFDCEYALTHASAAYSNAASKGYIAYATRRSLSRLTTTPPPGY
jgi:cysteinyl-tRNA synthetase